MNNPSKAITLLDDVLSRQQKLSESDAFDLPREVRLYASVQALKLERSGDLAGIVRLYQEVADKLQSAAKKAPRPYKPLFESAAEFWQAEAKKVEDKIAAQQEQQESVSSVSSTNQLKPSKDWRNILTTTPRKGYVSKQAKKRGQSSARIVFEK